jgi:hypothetical protein
MNNYSHPIDIKNERDLHTSIVKYLRRYHTDIFIIPTLGELADIKVK